MTREEALKGNVLISFRSPTLPFRLNFPSSLLYLSSPPFLFHYRLAAFFHPDNLLERPSYFTHNLFSSS